MQAYRRDADGVLTPVDTGQRRARKRDRPRPQSGTGPVGGDRALAATPDATASVAAVGDMRARPRTGALIGTVVIVGALIALGATRADAASSHEPCSTIHGSRKIDGHLGAREAMGTPIAPSSIHPARMPACTTHGARTGLYCPPRT
jgi:hypothetical protein